MPAEIQPLSLGFVNGYLAPAGDGFILVDTGMRGQRDVLEKALSAAGCTPGRLKLIILTHGDIDHTDNGAYLRQKYGARIAMHALDAPMVANGDLRPKRIVKSRLMRLMHAVMRLMGGTERMAANFERFTPDLNLEGGQSLTPFGFDATVHHLPGHKPGSIGLLARTGELIAGDTLENQGGRPRPTQIVADEAQLATSLASLAKLGITTVYPGHGKPFRWSQFSSGVHALRGYFLPPPRGV